MNSPHGVLLRATRAMQHSPIPALRKLNVEETDGHVMLTGRVSSYYLKQLAQETVMPFLNGRELFNEVNVLTEADLRRQTALGGQAV